MSTTIQSFRAELTKAVNGDSTADQSIQDFWTDFRLTGGILAAVAHAGGIVVLAAEPNVRTGIDRWDLDWAELRQELQEWTALDQQDS